MQNTLSTQYKTVLKALSFVLMFVIIAFFSAMMLAFPIKWMWNWLIPTLFNGPVISAVQAWGLMFLSAMLLSRSTVSSPREKENTSTSPKN
jgi:hypothetical protein